MHIRSTAPKPSRKQIPAPQLPDARDLILPKAPTPTLQRPVLIVPGGNSRSWGLPGVSNYLCHGGNNKYGGSIRTDKLEQFAHRHAQHGGNVFALEYSESFGSVEGNSKELTAAIEAVREATGFDEIDIVAECKGALEVRHHLQDGQDGIRNLVQFVPPNAGMPIAGDLASIAAELSVGLGLGVEKIAYFEVSEDTLDTFRDMRSDIGIGPLRWNPTLSKLNSETGLSKERDSLHSNTILMGQGHKTLLLPSRHYLGDGQVTPWSAKQKGANHFGFQGERAEHGRLSTHPEALQKMTEVFLEDGEVAKDKNHMKRTPVGAVSRAGFGLQSLSLAGQGVALASAFSGSTLGPVGLGLVTASGLSAGLDLIHYCSPSSSRSGWKRAGQVLSDLGQLAGLLAATQGQAWAAAGLLTGSQLLGLASS